MKKLILSLMLTASFSASATQYCYDQAVFEAYDMKEAIENCDSTLPTKRVDKLIKALTSPSIGYTIRVKRAMSKMYEYMHTDLGYKYAAYKDESVKKMFKKT